MTSKRTTIATHRHLGWAALLLVPAILGARGCDVAVVGSECGGLRGADCDRGQFCQFAPDAFCGAADQTGTCRDIPELCTLQFDPVCGCDGETYSNACAANSAGVSVATKGECAPAEQACGGLLGLQCGSGEFCDFAPDAFCGAADQTGTCKPRPEECGGVFAPVCGCDDNTYSNSCVANAAGVSVASQAECASQGTACGGLQGLQCSDGEFCNFAPDAFCGAADQTGTCTPLPEACIEIFTPVCGCDDKTYGNSCEANAAGVSVASQGECASQGTACGGLQGLQCSDGEFCDFPRDAFCGAADQTGLCTRIPQACDATLDPVCGCDGRTHANACEANTAGVAVASEGECEGSGGGTSCGGLLGGGCADGEFCNFAPDAFCGAADQTGTCEPQPELCTLEFNPVCGCDDQTYGNACAAHSAGVSVASDGECGNAGGTACGGLLGLACNPGEFCDFPPGAFCGAADQTGTCRTIPEACTQQFDPVCGCDDQTYGNACAANAAGISVASTGECP